MIYIYIYIYIYTALQIKAGQQSITDNLWPLTGHIYHVMVIVMVAFLRNLFFIIFRSSCMETFFKTGVIRNFAIFTRKSLQPATFFQPHPKRDFNTCEIPVKIVKFLQTAFLWNNSGGCFFQFDKIPV